MSFSLVPLLFFLVSCSTFLQSQGQPFQGSYLPPSQGQQMDIKAMRDHHFDRLR